MRRERRQPTRPELAKITSRKQVVRRVPAPEKPPRLGPNGPGPQGASLGRSAEIDNTSYNCSHAPGPDEEGLPRPDRGSRAEERRQ